MNATYGDLLASYARLVESGHADKDLTRKQRAIVADLVHIAAATVKYDTYPASAAAVHEARMAVTRAVGSTALVITDYYEWDAAVTRALEIVSNA